MKHCICGLMIIVAGVSFIGCRAEVKSTPDSVKVEAEVPKLEVKKTPDLNPSTDDDVDIDTPAPGDK